MGIGTAGIGDPLVVFKRKFRWTLEIFGQNCPFHIPPWFVTVAARPNISFDETEINFLNDKTWIPGKATWESITVTMLDVGGAGASNDGVQIYKWLLSVFDFRSPTHKFMSSNIAGYAGTAILTMWDGCGTEMETWTFDDAWPQAVNFGDLDYSSSDIANIELTMRYSKVSFRPGCGANLEFCGCTGC